MLKRLFNIILCVALAVAAQAQELNCKVTIKSDAILNTDKQVFLSMERAISDFINTRKWTTDQFGPTEKIDCSILINLTAKMQGDEDAYAATMSIQASRPVYNASYTTTTIKYIDRDVVFKYSQFNPLQFDDNRVSGNDPLVSNLTALLAFYSYMIIGLDYESFAPNGGSVYFKKAQNVVNNAPELKAITGWRAVDGNRNRYWLTDQLLSPRFTAYRDFWYILHREALDNMFNKPEESRKKILAGITTLSQLQKENPGAILLQFFFNAKSEEILGIMAQVPKQERTPYITQLQQMDVPNAQRYNALK